ncbi:hypothetical protein [Streptomyces sp. NPDC059468]|uniref:hypothetical protein n=1 Tax=Streptomyces sp. NPDC059468 TaxID=3346845 RepID=UPI00368A9938
MGNFEWVEFSFEVDIDSDDFPKARSVEDLDKIATDQISKALAADIEEARLNTAEKNSYIHLYQQEN